jgi:hypothetical protein
MTNTTTKTTTKTTNEAAWSMRDHFAAHALTGLVASAAAHNFATTANIAYAMADAMLVERAKREEEA